MFSHDSKVLTAFPSAADGEDDLDLGVLVSQLGEGPETPLGAIHRHLGIGPLIAQL